MSNPKIETVYPGTAGRTARTRCSLPRDKSLIDCYRTLMHDPKFESIKFVLGRHFFEAYSLNGYNSLY